MPGSVGRGLDLDLRVRPAAPAAALATSLVDDQKTRVAHPGSTLKIKFFINFLLYFGQ